MSRNRSLRRRRDGISLGRISLGVLGVALALSCFIF